MSSDLSPEEYQRASEIFNELQDVPASELDAALDAACAGNAKLRSEVAQLLRADRSAAGFLTHSAMKDAALLLSSEAAAPAPATIAHYEILSKLGEGGMGEVWRGRDSKLDREVAIKILPEAFAADPDRMARFAREAQVLASLNHPNIAVIYGVEDRALIMELVDGPTLAERIASGPIAWEEAVEIACQIAGALEAAHERGIVHRDLKPANIKLTADGRVKVLDFGLAKPPANDAAPSGLTSPTNVSPSSMPGMILGTAPYMAPEQAKGRSVDRRADIWAFGVVLYEMLAGRNPFQGETVAETLAAVLRAETDLGVLPLAARPIVERCLRKDPRRRWQSIGDTRIAIEESVAGGSPDVTVARTPRLQRMVWAGIGVVSTAAVLILGGLLTRREQAMPPPIEFAVDSPEHGALPLEPLLRVSPNGEFVLFLATDPADDVRRAYLYSVSNGSTRTLPGTEQTTDASWSFDSKSLLLSRGGALSRMDISGNAPQPLPFESGYSSWKQDGVATTTREGIKWFQPSRNGAGGNGSRLILPNNPAARLVYLFPTLIGGGRVMLYNAYNGEPATGVSVEIASIDGTNRHKLFSAERSAIYAGPGYALYLRGDTLMARAIDPANGELRGEPHPIAGPVEEAMGSVDPGTFSASDNGVLAFRKVSANAEYRLVWFDRTGKRLGAVAGVADYSNPALSPDGNRLAVGIRDPGTGKRDLWVLDLRRGAASRITFDLSDHANPAWSSDGSRIAYSSDRRGARDIYVKNASGIGEGTLLAQSTIPKNVEDWSRDGKWIVYNEAVPNNGDDLVALSLDTRKSRDILRTRFEEDKGCFSPDGHWMAYQSDESGRAEAYIQPFPPDGRKWQISSDHGGAPQWRGDGKELYYSTLTNPSRMMAVDIAVKDNAIAAGIPHLLFEVTLPPLGPRNRWVVTRDGRKFLAVVPVARKPLNSFTVIVNWPSLLPKR